MELRRGDAFLTHEGGAVHQPDRGRFKGQGAVQHPGAVPHYEVAFAPLVAQGEPGLRRPGQQPVQQRAPLVGRPAASR